MALPSAGPTDCSSGLSARIFNNFRYDNPWQASQGGVAVGTLVCPTTPNGFGYRCSAITTGITASGEPTWPVVLTNTVVDGGVTWTCQDVANPTGKAHPPAGQFGYVFTSADLDGFRLLAYNQAKAIATSSRPTTARPSTTRRRPEHQQRHADDHRLWHVVKDTDSAVTTTDASWHFTCPAGKGGDYFVSGCLAYSATLTATDVEIDILINGTTVDAHPGRAARRPTR
jgi:hypothetical protein